LLHERPAALATTTTHLARSGFDAGLLVAAPDAARLEHQERRAAALRPLTLALATDRDPLRLQAPPLDWLQRFAARHRHELVLVEADGARRRLVKLPGLGEPAWPAVPLAGVVVVAGGGALGATLARAAHRPAAFGGGARRVTGRDLETMLRRYLERVPRGVPVAILVTGLDRSWQRLAMQWARRARRVLQARRNDVPLRVVLLPDETAPPVAIARWRGARRIPERFAGVDGILLAAGRGTRFASEGDSKLLHSWRGRSLVEHAVHAWSRVGFGSLWLVTGHAGPEVARQARRAADRRLAVVFNPGHGRGLGTSVRRGVAASRSGAALVFGHADMPWLRAATVQRIVAAGESLATRIVVPTVGGRPRNPVYFPADLRPRLGRVPAGRGGKAVIDALPQRVFHLPMDDAGAEFDDVDRRGDLRRRRLAGRTR
jgi:molybdenum cofactor cytidylyltransferase